MLFPRHIACVAISCVRVLNRFGLFREYHHRHLMTQITPCRKTNSQTVNAAQPAEINLIPRAESCRPTLALSKYVHLSPYGMDITGGNQKSIGESGSIGKGCPRIEGLR